MQVLSSLQIAYMDMVGFVIEATPGTDGTVDATSRGTITRLPFTVSLKKKCGSYNFVEKLYNIRKWQPLLAVSFKSSLFSKMNWQPRSWPGTAQINCIFVFFKNPTLEFTALETEELLRPPNLTAAGFIFIIRMVWFSILTKSSLFLYLESSLFFVVDQLLTHLEALLGGRCSEHWKRNGKIKFGQNGASFQPIFFRHFFPNLK